MEWYPGSIIEAIQTSRANNAFVVVYVEGTDDASKTTNEVLDKANVAEKLKGKEFVCIKLLKDSPGHKQFAEVYKTVPVPSVFFIAQDGKVSEVVIGHKEPSTVESRIVAAVEKCLTIKLAGSCSSSPQQLPVDPPPTVAAPTVQPVVTPSSSTSSISDETQKSLDEQSQQSQSSIVNFSPSLDERVEKAKLLINEKKEEKMKEDREKEKEAERERRRIGLEMHKARQNRQEQEMREALEERKKNSVEDAIARKKILDQIAQDRADRLNREKKQKAEAAAQSQTTSQPSAQSSTPPSDGDVARLQFRLPMGETKNHVFTSSTTLLEIREFIDNNITLPFREYQIATTFPMREFTWRDNSQTLRSLNLLPSAVLLILPVQGHVVSRPNDWTKAMVALFWSIVTPILSVPMYLSRMIFGGGTSTEGGSVRPQGGGASSAPSSAQPSQQQPFMPRTTIRKRGNIHTLADGNDSKDDDDNNTWNGNSTQQM